MKSARTRTRVVIYSNSKDIDTMTIYGESKDFYIVEIFEKSDEVWSLSELMDYVTFNDIKKILIPSCSTLTRKPVEFINFLNELNEAGISLVVYNNNIESLQDDGTSNPSFNFLLNVWNEFDMIQKRLTRERLEISYNHFRFRGGRVGRKEGYRKKEPQYKMEYSRELNLLSEGLSLKECKRKTGTSINTLRKLKKMFVYDII